MITKVAVIYICQTATFSDFQIFAEISLKVAINSWQSEAIDSSSIQHKLFKIIKNDSKVFAKQNHMPGNVLPDYPSILNEFIPLGKPSIDQNRVGLNKL